MAQYSILPKQTSRSFSVVSLLQILNFSRNISDEGFDLSLVGSLTNIGPLDALITFVDPVTSVNICTGA